MNRCIVVGCTVKVTALGLCMRHYTQFRTHGKITHIHKYKRPLCSVEGCDKLSSAKGYCHTHYKRWVRHGDVTVNQGFPFRPPARTCEVEGCERKHYCRGYCKMHHKRWERHGDPLVVGKWGVRDSAVQLG